MDMTTKPTKVHGGLIRRESRVSIDRQGNKTTQHWDGRKDVQIKARPANTRAVPNTPGEK